jgi:Xaa-Pro aminopeptidase
MVDTNLLTNLFHHLRTENHDLLERMRIVTSNDELKKLQKLDKVNSALMKALLAYINHNSIETE